MLNKDKMMIRNHVKLYRVTLFSQFVLIIFLMSVVIFPTMAFAALPEVDIELSVNSFPVQEVEFNTNIYFDAVITDPDGDPINAYSWESSLDGAFSIAPPPFWLSNLSVGTHVITLSVIDSNNEIGTDTINLTVLPVNPDASILTPGHLDTLINNNPFAVTDTDGNAIIFQGDATDLQDDKNGMDDGDISLEWDFVGSDGVSEFNPKYTGATLPPITNLPADTYTVRLTATDSDGNTDTDEITIIVVEDDDFNPINVDILQPADNAAYQKGEMITFRGSAQDASGQSLTGTSLVWTSNQDGQFGTGEIVRADNLSEGEHVITLTATDDEGRSSTISSAAFPNPITIIVGNTIPLSKAVITSPVTLTTFAPGQAIVFQGHGEDAGEEVIPASSLTFKWTSSLEGAASFAEGPTATISSLREGTHTITLTVTDSKGISVSEQIVVSVGSKPSCSITSPLDGSSYESGDTILFTATATDPEGGMLPADSLSWISTVDGTLGTGTSFVATLSTGTHKITMTATDSQGFQCSDTVLINVATGIPVIDKHITITPAAGPYYVNDYIEFEVAFSDKEDGSLTGSSLVWTSSLETASIGTGERLITNALSQGEHLITVTATDQDGNTRKDFVTVAVENREPGEGSVSILSPLNGASFASGELITFQGSAEDPDEGPLTGTSLVWTSSKGDTMGTGEVFTTSSLSSGTHVITLTATDSNGKASSTAITIIVGNAEPVANITAPADGSFYDFGAAISFEGSGTDAEDGNIPSSDLVWTLVNTSSGAPETLGHGNFMSVADLPKGNNTIRLTVTDSEGATASDEIVVIVGNASPVATITAPLNQTTHAFESLVTFTGTGTDPDGESVTLSWSSDVNGFFGAGTSVAVSALSVGTHVITLKVTDSSGLTASDTITITISDDEPTALITAPQDNSKHAFGSAITFSGKGTDPEGGTPTLSWTSDVNGFLGDGASFSNTSLSVGTHVITLKVTDSSGLTASDTITIMITDDEPTALITAPQDNSKHAFGSAITFSGKGTDPEGGALTLSWTSDVNGFLGDGASFSNTSLSVGTHVITLKVTDSSGLTASDTITITISDEGPKTVKITSPGDGDVFSLNTYIHFEGYAEDNEDVEITGSNLVWTSNLESSILGTGKKFAMNSLAIGEHLITLTATDSSGGSEKDFITITVESMLPEQLMISSPLDGTFFDEGETINFVGSAVDAEDGTLRGNALSWKSSIDGYIGSGVSFSASLSQGEHVVSMTAIDSDGGVSTTSISLSIRGTSQSLPLSLDNSDVQIPVNKVVSVNISNGHPPYRLYEDYPEIAVFELSGSVITIFPRTTGITTAQVYDHENSIITLKLTVTESTDDVPFANAGPDRNVEEGTTVVLDASASLPGSHGIASWKWTQTAGKPIVVLSDDRAEKATFVAPLVDDTTTATQFSFRLTLVDNNGNQGLDDVSISVYDNGINVYPDDAITFMSVDMVSPLGIKVVGEGDLVRLETFFTEVITDSLNRPGETLYGLIDFDIKVPSGAAATVMLYLPQSLGENFFPYKHGTSLGWYRFDDNVSYDSDRKKIFFTPVDGGKGDDDGIANGIITDPLTFGTLSDTPSPPDNGDSSGGGCFISTLLE